MHFYSRVLCVCVCREDRAQLAAEMRSLKAAHDKALLDARTKYVITETDRQQQMTDRHTAADQQLHQQSSGDWMQVEKTVSSAGSVDISAVSTNELELKRRVDKLSSMITEVCLVELCCSMVISVHSMVTMSVMVQCCWTFNDCVSLLADKHWAVNDCVSLLADKHWAVNDCMSLLADKHWAVNDCVSLLADKHWAVNDCVSLLADKHCAVNDCVSLLADKHCAVNDCVSLLAINTALLMTVCLS